MGTFSLPLGFVTATIGAAAAVGSLPLGATLRGCGDCGTFLTVSAIAAVVGAETVVAQAMTGEIG